MEHEHMASQPSWKTLIAEIVDQLPPHFALRDVLRFEESLAKFYPANKHIAAKIRQTLQILRDQGVIAFEGPGRYTKLATAPRYSPIIDFATAGDLMSKAQIARQVLETWAEFNLFCFACDADSLTRLGANTQVAGKNGRFGSRISGAAYRPLIESIRAGICPHYVLVEYDQRYSTVVFGSAIAGDQITEDRIIARNPLAATAKRAGWIGCTIDIAGLPSVSIIEPMSLDPSQVRAEWNALHASGATNERELRKRS